MAPHSLILLQNKGHFKETKPKHLLGFVRHLYSDLKSQCYISSWVFYFWSERRTWVIVKLTWARVVPLQKNTTCKWVCLGHNESRMSVGLQSYTCKLKGKTLLKCFLTFSMQAGAKLGSWGFLKALQWDVGRDRKNCCAKCWCFNCKCMHLFKLIL